MDNDFNDYDYYDFYDNQEQSEDQQLDYDEENVDIYEDNMFDESDDFDEFGNVMFDNECFESQSFITNMDNCDKYIINKAIYDSNLFHIIYIENVAFRGSGRIDKSMFSLHTKEIGINLTNFWKIFDILKKKKKIY